MVHRNLLVMERRVGLVGRDNLAGSREEVARKKN